MANGNDRKLGLEFIKSLIQENNLPKANKQQPEQQPNVVPNKEIVEDISNEIIGEKLDSVRRTKDLLKESGFRSDDQSAIKFLKQNNVENPNIVPDVSDIPTQEDSTLVEPLNDIIEKAAMTTPAMMILSGLRGPLEILSEGFKRWETLKVNFAKEFPKLGAAAGFTPEVAQSLLGGGGETEFPDALLRNSDRPEFGDFFRKLGVPEFLSATGGLAAEILTDFPIFTGAGIVAGKALSSAGKTKQISSAIDSLSKLDNKLKVTEKLMAFRNTEFVKSLEQAARGISRFQPLPVEVRQSLRRIYGETNASSIEAGHIAGVIERIATKDVKKFFGKPIAKELDSSKLELIDSAIQGNSTAMSQLSKREQVIVKSAQDLLADRQAKLSAEIDEVIATNPLDFRKLAEEKYGVRDGSKLSLDELSRTIKENQGHHVKRQYRIFQERGYKPSQESIDKAVIGLQDDLGILESEAAARVKAILENKEINLSNLAGKDIKVKQGSFIKRQDIPPYLRELMGEIKDPRYNLIQTVRTATENAETFKLYRKMSDMGLFSDVPTETLTRKVPQNGPQVWGLVDGKYTSPEIHALLTHVKNTADVEDKIVIRSMQALKGVKTIFNPKTHAHNFLGNLGYFSVLDGVHLFNNPKIYKNAKDIISAGSKFSKGLTSKNNPLVKQYREMVEQGIIGSEFANAEQIKWLDDMIRDPYSVKKHSDISRGTEAAARKVAELYSWEDQLFKAASYLHKRNVRKMNPIQARDEVYKWYPNYLEASKLADDARRSAGGLMFLNPFLTFRLEAHRILLNSLTDPTKRLAAALLFGHRAAFNTAVLGFSGMGLKDIFEFYGTRPEAISEIVLNPLSPKGNLDLNTKYLDPFNTQGLFAPMLALSGATGQNPFDYLLDFTTMSPEFGYSQLLVQAIEPLLTGRGRFNQELEIGESLQKTVKRLGPTSFTTDLPKILSSKTEQDEKVRRIFRFAGVDVEKRNPFWVKSKVKKRLTEKLQRGDDIQSTLSAIEFLGFDSQKMLSSAERSVNKQQPRQKTSGLDKFIDSLGL